ncbi:LppP/LprE family lipoprotein [Rhodococcus aerolatus]
MRGNYDPCATLSAALVYVEGATGGSPVQALLFHDGTYIGTATSTAYGFTSLNPSLSEGDTVALNYRTGGSCSACDDGTTTTVRYQWDGTSVQMLDDLPYGSGSGSAATSSAASTTEPVCRGVNCPKPGVVGNPGGPRSRGVALVSCPRDQEVGTGLYADGQLDYAPECLPGGSGGR